jgi:TolB-like protein
MIEVQLLGGASLRCDGKPVSGPPAQRHRIALLALVAAAWPRPLSRDKAMALLWPERDTANARRLLNLAVHVLRAALGEAALVSTTGDGLLLDPAHVRCDLQQLRAAIADGDVAGVVRQPAGALLDGFHLDESAEFASWLDDRRAELAHAQVDALHALAARQEREGDVHGRVVTSRRLVAADPCSGPHALALMRALEAAGDRAGAVQHAAEHARRLRAELELEPDAEVTALAERLRAAPPRRAAVPRTTTGAIAVLPFVNRSDQADDEWFADGITEDVIAHLSRIRALTVISRASVMAFQGARRSPREAGAALGAATLLDGSVRRAGDRVRIVATLVDVESERQLWAETYDRELTDIFAIQTDVALRIAAALEAELTRDERERVTRPPTRDLAAYQLFLMARQWHIRYSMEGYAPAIAHYERALARDPSFALAAAYMAIALTEAAEHGAILPAEAFPRAARAVASALRLDPELAEAHCADGHLRTVSAFDWVGAERAYRRALELKPGDADTHDLFGRMLAGIGRWDEAIAMLRRAREHDPLTHRSDLPSTLLRAGRLEEATRLLEEAVELEPGYDRAHATLGWAYILAGRTAEGVARLERAVALGDGSTLWLAQLGQAYGMAGEVAKARAVLATLGARAAREAFVSPYHLAYVHTGLGDVDRAIDLLERAVAERTGAGYAIKGSFLFAPLRGTPRFEALLRSMGL